MSAKVHSYCYGPAFAFGSFQSTELGNFFFMKNEEFTLIFPIQTEYDMVFTSILPFIIY